jgi:hypothetical protein
MLNCVGVLLLVSVATGQEVKNVPMPVELQQQIDERIIGERTYEVAWGEKKYTGEEKTRWIGRKSGILTQGFVVEDGERVNYVVLQGWDGNTEALVGRGFNSNGETWAESWTEFSKEKWTGHGEGIYQGKRWKSPAKLEFLKDSTRYEDITDGKPWVSVSKWKPNSRDKGK